jgi:hypothetical protein
MAISSRKLPARTSSSALASVDEPLLIAPLVLGRSRRDLPQLQARLVARKAWATPAFPPPFFVCEKKKRFSLKGQ